MLSITQRNKQEALAALSDAMKKGDEKAIKQAWNDFHESVVECVKQDYVEADGNKVILAQRGYRQLTSEETRYYEKMIEAGKKNILCRS